jgi:FtsP/CotA-like multicopper oxidase with cupredoxin domain
MIVQDRRFDRDGRFVEGEHRATGLLGDTLLVNGTVGPYLNVTTERVRLRLLNASTAPDLRLRPGRRSPLRAHRQRRGAAASPA